MPVESGKIDEAIKLLSNYIHGKEAALRLALMCVFSRGQLLIEDMPGLGKTTLAIAIAKILGLSFGRIQFTSDLLPSDITGLSIFDNNSSSFQFHPGPIFNQIVLADEINRATPKTQSALLEAMEEHQVTAEGITRPLPEPFFVIATQNPAHQVGTFPLPESQLDRFLLRLELGYPDSRAERALLESGGRRSQVAALAPCLTPPALAGLQDEVARVHAAPPLLDYVQALVEASRRAPAFRHGLSPRAALALLAVSRAWAYLAGRRQVLPEDVQAVWPALACHRLPLAQGSGHASPEEALALLRGVALP